MHRAFPAIDLLLNGAMFTLDLPGGSIWAWRCHADWGRRGRRLAAARHLAVGALFLWRQRDWRRRCFRWIMLRIPVFARPWARRWGLFIAQMMGFLALPFLLLQAHGRSHLQTGLFITAWPWPRP